jgi:hypothetical protein
MFRAALARWLQTPPVSGWQALLVAMFAIWLPTIVRAAVSGVVTGCEFTPYLPFVLICAILLRWWQAGAVALVSVAILGGLFGGSPPHHMSCFVPAAGIFLASSAIMIAVAILARWAIVQVRRPDDSAGGVVFSLDKGDVWASWNGQGMPVRLGSQRRVAHMMLDFLARQKPDERSS